MSPCMNSIAMTRRVVYSQKTVGSADQGAVVAVKVAADGLGIGGFEGEVGFVADDVGEFLGEAGDVVPNGPSWSGW